MANKISEIIDEKAFAQLEKTIQLLKGAQTELAATVTSAANLNAELGKAKGYKELEVAAQKVVESGKALEAASVKAEKASVETAKAEKNLIEIAKDKLAVDQKTRKLLNEMSGTVEQNIKVQVGLKRILTQTRDALKANEKGLKDGTVSLEDYTQNLEELSIQEAEAKKTIVDFNLEIRRGLKEANAAEDSYDQMSATLDRLRGLYRRLTKEERESAEVGGLLLLQIQERDKELKDLDKTMGISTRNVGSYREAIDEALDASGLFADQMQYLARAKQLYTAAAKVATTQTASFKAILISSGIGLIIVLLGAVITYFSKFQGGIDKVSVLMAKFNAVVDVLVGYLGKLGEQVSKAVLPVLKNLGNILLGIATFNYEMIKEGIKGIGDAVATIEPLRLTEITRAMGEAADAAERLRNAEIALERSQIAATTQQAKLNKELEYYNAIADDATLSFEQQRKANLAALDIQQKLINSSVDLAKQEESLVNQRVEAAKKNGTLSRELEQEQADAIAKRIEAETGLTSAIMASGRQRRQLKQDQLEQDLDILIDGFDNQKSINERLIANERLSFSERKAILEETKRLSDGSFEDQIAVIQSFTKEKVDADDLLAASDARVLNQKIKDLGLSEIIGKRLLEVVRDRRTAVQDLNEVEIELAEERRQKERESFEKYIEAKVATMTRESAVVLQEMEKQETDALAVLATSYANGEILAAEYYQRRADITKKGVIDTVNFEIEALQKLIDFNKSQGLDTFDQERELAALRIQLAKDTTDQQIEEAERLAAFEEELAEKKKELLNGVATLALTVVAARFQRENEDLERQAELIEENKNKDIERVNESAASENEKAVKIAQIEAKALKQTEQNEAKKRALQEKQARFDKAVQIAGIIGSTALAIIKQLAATPLPFGAPLVATIAAIGAVQLGTAIATPIPKFATGTQNAPEGWAIVGEQGKELRTDPDGTRSLTPGKATLTYLEKGTKITPAPETKRQLAAEGLSSIMNYDKNGNYNFDKLAESYERGSKKIVDAVKSKRQISHNITAGGVRRIVETSTSRTEYLNRNL